MCLVRHVESDPYENWRDVTIKMDVKRLVVKHTS